MHESLIIGDDIRIVVLDIRGDKIRLGIEAPADVRIDRLEVRARIDAGEIRRARP